MTFGARGLPERQHAGPLPTRVRRVLELPVTSCACRGEIQAERVDGLTIGVAGLGPRPGQPCPQTKTAGRARCRERLEMFDTRTLPTTGMRRGPLNVDYAGGANPFAVNGGTRLHLGILAAPWIGPGVPGPRRPKHDPRGGLLAELSCS